MQRVINIQLTRLLDCPEEEPSLQQDSLVPFPLQLPLWHSSLSIVSSVEVTDGEGPTCSTFATSGSLSRSKMAIHSWAIFRCRENWGPFINSENMEAEDVSPSRAAPGIVVDSPASLSCHSSLQRLLYRQYSSVHELER